MIQFISNKLARIYLEGLIYAVAHEEHPVYTQKNQRGLYGWMSCFGFILIDVKKDLG